MSFKGKEIVKLYSALIVIVLVIGQALASHKEGVTTVKIVWIVIAQKQVNVQTVKDNIKFLRQTVLYSRNSKTKVKDKSTESYKHPVQIVKMRILFINCQSFKTAYGLSDTIEKYDIDVLCLNETFEIVTV